MKRQKILTYAAVAVGIVILLILVRWAGIRHLTNLGQKEETRYRQLLHQGNIRSANQTATKTIKIYKNILILDPGNPEVLSSLSQLMSERRNYVEARRYSEMAVKADPGNIENHYYLGLSCMRMKRWDMAEEAISRALKIDPTHGRSIEALARLKIKQKNNKKAREILTGAIESGYGTPEIFFLLYEITRDADRMDMAIDTLEKSLTLDEPPKKAYKELLEWYKKSQQEDKIEQLRKTWLEKYSRDSAEHIRVANSLIRENPKRAEEIYLQATRIERENLESINPAEKDLSAHFILSGFYHRQNRHSEAVEILEELIPFLPNSQALYFYLGFYHYSAEDFKTARRELLRSISIDETNPGPLNLLAWMYLTAPRESPFYNPKEALSLSRRAVARNSKSGAFVDTLARAYYVNGRIQEALRYYGKNERRKRSYSYALYGLALCHYHLGDESKGDNYMKQAVENRFNGWKLVRNDQDISQVRDNPYLQDLLRRHTENEHEEN